MDEEINKTQLELSGLTCCEQAIKGEKTEVSIVCDTFNHEKYIAKAIESFLMQKTSFKFEVLIHDDASTDRTVEIIQKYVEKYPDIIKPIFQKENQYSQHINIQLTYQSPRARGKYLALCEGDDFWEDPMKLQKQYEVLENHPELDICAHGANLVNESGETVLQQIAPRDIECVIPVEDVIMGEGGFVATNSLMYRKSLNQHIPNFRKALFLDYTLQIHGSLRGGMYYLSDIMSSYRYMATGSWTSRMTQNHNLSHDFFEKKQKMLDCLDSDTKSEYHEIIKKRQLTNEFIDLNDNKLYREALGEKYKMIVKELPRMEQVKLIIKSRFPHLLHLLKKE